MVNGCCKFAAYELFEVLFADFDFFGEAENVDDIFITLKTDRSEKSCYWQFLLAINVGVHDIVDVSRKLNPAAAERDDSCGVEFCAVGVCALSEEYTRRTVQLRYDNALGTVYDEGAVLCHVGYLPEIHVLYHSVEILMVRIGAIQFELSFQGNAVGQSSCEAFLN